MDREGIVQVINEQKSHQSLLNEKKKIKDTKYMFYIYVIYVIDDIHKYMLYMICIFFFLCIFSKQSPCFGNLYNLVNISRD